MTDYASSLKNTDVPKKKAKISYFGSTYTPLLIEMAHDRRNQIVTTTKPNSPLFPSNYVAPIAIPNATNLTSSP